MVKSMSKVSHPYLPLTDKMRKEMLKELGLSDISELYRDIPKEFLLKKELDLPSMKSEIEVFKKIRELAAKNKSVFDMPTFLGAGVWPHYVPAVLIELIQRGEFLTAYTPYQPEISQGMLQALFEYQSLMAELLGMDIVNASMYDWASALGEAALMAARIKRRNKILVPEIISPERYKTLITYTEPLDVKVETIKHTETGEIDLDDLNSKIDEDTAGVYVEVPSYFGILDSQLPDISDIVHKKDAIFIVGVDPTSLGIIKSPGDYGADIAIGEGQPLGNLVGFGGPLLGIFATRDDRDFIKQMPGRIIGLTTTEDESEYGFVMALQTREQHIRRERATSNICSNEALCAVAAAIYTSLLGPTGFKQLGENILYNTYYAIKKLSTIDGLKVPLFNAAHFKEFLVNFDNVSVNSKTVHKELLKRNIHGGHIISDEFPKLGDNMLLCVTEIHSKEDIDKLVSALSDIIRGN